VVKVKLYKTDSGNRPLSSEVVYVLSGLEGRRVKEISELFPWTVVPIFWQNIPIMSFSVMFLTVDKKGQGSFPNPALFSLDAGFNPNFNPG